MEAERIIKEKEIVHDSEHKDYASKGVGNAGLTLGIIGTALGAWAVSRNRGGLFGGGCGAGMPENVNINTTTGGSGWFRRRCSYCIYGLGKGLRGSSCLDECHVGIEGLRNASRLRPS